MPTRTVFINNGSYFLNSFEQKILQQNEHVWITLDNVIIID